MARAFGLASYFRGKSRLESLLDPLLGLPRRPTRIDFGNGLNLELDGRSAYDRSCYVHDADRDIARLIRTVVRPGDVFLDCGAHYGYFTLLAARAAGPSGRVYSFEPSPETFARLCRNLDANRANNVSPFKMALGESSARHHIYRLDRWNTGMNSLEPTELAEDLGEVDVEALDQLIASGVVEPPAVMKMDVEGAELSILKGATRLLKERSPILVIELSRTTQRRFGYMPEDIIKYLLDLREYRIEWLFNGRRPVLPDQELPHYRRLGFEHGANYAFWPRSDWGLRQLGAA